MPLICLANMYLGFLGLLVSTGFWVHSLDIGIPSKLMLICLLFIVINGVSFVFYNTPIIQAFLKNVKETERR
jgi:PhoPQ-activated pathogenicity-related protein